MSSLCSRCPFFQTAPKIKHKNARKRCRIEPTRTLRFYKCGDFPSNPILDWKRKPKGRSLTSKLTSTIVPKKITGNI